MNACGDTEPQAQTKEKIQTKQISRPPVIKRKPQQPTTPQSEASKANSLDLLPAKSKIGAGSTTPNAFSEGTRQTRGDGGAINRGEEKQAYLDRNFDYIRRKIQEYLRYPAVAVRMGWQGMVTLRFILQKDGNVEGISVTQSSGFNILDENAKKRLKRQPHSRPLLSVRNHPPRGLPATLNDEGVEFYSLTKRANKGVRLKAHEGNRFF